MEEKIGIGVQQSHESSIGTEESHTGVGAEMHARMQDQFGTVARLATQAREGQADPSQPKQEQEGEKGLSGLGADTHVMLESLKAAARANQGSEANHIPNEEIQRAQDLQSEIRDLRPDQLEEVMPAHLQQEFGQVVLEQPGTLSEKKGFFSRVFNSKLFSWFRRFFPKH